MATLAHELPLVLSRRTTAQVLGVSEGTIHNLVKAGALKPLETPLRRVLFSRGEILRFIGADDG